MRSGEETGEGKTSASVRGRSHAGEAVKVNGCRFNWIDRTGAAGCGMDLDESDWAMQQLRLHEQPLRLAGTSAFAGSAITTTCIHIRSRLSVMANRRFMDLS